MTALSLRSRLLIAVGAIALISLVIADLTVYASLRSYLYRQVDATLEVSHRSIEAVAQGAHVGGGPDIGGPAPFGPPPSTSNFCQIGRESAPGMFIEVRDAEDSIVGGEECSAFVPGQRAYVPKLPNTISGFVRNVADFDEPTAYFTVVSTNPTGPSFRVRASKLRNGGTLIVADPISGLENTLQQLLVLELSVTARRSRPVGSPRSVARPPRPSSPQRRRAHGRGDLRR